ncbi:hypothetical protein [Hydrocoleum sp. CS-953]|uniref:hypothetical protein n=1 Tax=Microcoleaceae TaxID=1892252 RepID=UPI000B9C2D07|nr:hypothetical protein [Hydrocoleum sp. CS-953]OZH51984.1 hypothetical protein AFK68_27350 [Hydrocoleum sp. CS-953]
MVLNDSQSENLTDEQWNIAHKIANDLTIEETDVNELRKIISYLQFTNRDNIGSSFFVYLKVLARNGNNTRHSKKTPEYDENLEITCKKHLKKYENNPQVMLKILGWASRLMKYYKVAPVGETVDNSSNISEPTISQRQEKIEESKKALQLKEGDILDAKVIKKSSTGKKVTYEIDGIPYTEKEPKNFDNENLVENGNVKVAVKSLKEDGSINHIKFYKE